MKLSEQLQELINALEESDKRFKKRTEDFIKSSNRLIESIDRQIEILKD